MDISEKGIRENNERGVVCPGGKEIIMDYMRVVRVGIGYDVHRLVKGRPLVLGGVDIPYSLGLLGHSDADCLTHAICDALLGAGGLGDIGRHFPDSDPKYKDINSLKLLDKVADMLGDAGFSILNIDAVIIAQEPKLSPYISKMEKNIKVVLSKLIISMNKNVKKDKWSIKENTGYAPCKEDNDTIKDRLKTKAVNIKATTTEGLGFEGGKKGIACKAVVSLLYAA